MHIDWETDFFHGLAMDIWELAMPAAQTRLEAEFLKERLRLAPGANVLDIPCGRGRHSLELAALGFSVTGLDLGRENVERAALHERVLAPGKAVNWVLGDMREIAFHDEFDGAFCFGNSFGYLNAASAAGVLTRIARSLHRGGRFALETGMVAEGILPTLQRNRWFEAGGIYMLSRNQYDARESCLDIEYTFIRDGERVTHNTTSFVFTVNEICRMHEAAGFRIVELLSSVRGDPFQLGSMPLILVAEKL